VASMYEARRQLVVKEGSADASVTSAATLSVVSTFASPSSTTAVYTRPGQHLISAHSHSAVTLRIRSHECHSAHKSDRCLFHGLFSRTAWVHQHQKG